MKTPHTLFLGSLLTLWALPALAHGDEDHGGAHASPAAPPPVAAPRAQAQTDAFELVAMLAEGRLVLSIDRFETNEPVAGARVEVDAGGIQAVATPATPGEYLVDLPALRQPGRHPLAVTVETADSADLLTATLEVPPPPTPAMEPLLPSRWAPWGAGGLLLSGIGLLALRRRQSTSPSAQGPA